MRCSFQKKTKKSNNNKNFQDISTWRFFSIGKQAQTRDDKSRMVMMIALVLFFFFFLFFSKSQDNNAGANPRKLFHCWDRTKHIHVPKPDVPRSFDDNTECIRWNVTGWINTARHKRLLASWPKRARHFLCLLKCRHFFFSEGDKIVSIIYLRWGIYFLKWPTTEHQFILFLGGIYFLEWYILSLIWSVPFIDWSDYVGWGV